MDAIVYPKGTAVKFTSGRRIGEIWFVAYDYRGGNDNLYLAEWSSKNRRLVGGMILCGDDVNSVSDSIGLQLTDLQ
jgi:hypothetical protein